MVELVEASEVVEEVDPGAVLSLIEKWKKRLGLGDWQIAVAVRDNTGINEVASLSHNWLRRRAVIYISKDFHNVRDWARETLLGYDGEHNLESTIVHELLHLVEQPFGSMLADGLDDQGRAMRDLWRDYREWWIEKMERTLMDAERGEWVTA